MEIKHRSISNHPEPTMLNKLAKLIPLFVLVVAAPSFAAGKYSNSNHRGQIAAGKTGKYLSNLNLTPAQKTKIEALKATTKTQIEAVLTPEQRQQYQQVDAQRQTNRQDGNNLSLTAEQKTQLRAMREASKAQFKAILTPEQQAQMAQSVGGWSKDAMSKLNLTADQKAKMVQLRASARSQMETILTPAQQQQAKSRVNTLKNLNLTAEQQTKIQAIRQSSERELNAILTPEQQSLRKSGRQGKWQKNG